MLIDLKNLIDKYNLNIKGIFHIGAHTAEEYDIYKNSNIDNVLWFEADPKQYEICVNNLNGKGQQVFNYALYEKTGEKIKFNLSNNTQCSSILKLKKHSNYYPNIVMNETIEMETIRLDDICKKHDIDFKKFNFVNLDIQGAELYAIKGFGDIIQNIDYIYSEVNAAELYEGCHTISQIDEYLKQFGFVRVETCWTHAEWGDALYVKGPKLKIITTTYNNSKWVNQNITSVLNQTYKNFDVLYIDDCSTDDTYEQAVDIINNDSRFKIIKHEENKSKAYSFATHLQKFINEDDLVVFLDGDDWLLDENVLDSVVKTYLKTNYWVGYGGMYCWDGKSENVELANPQNTPYPYQVHQLNYYRNDVFRCSHLKTVKGFLLKKLKESDFKFQNNWIKYGDDLVIMCAAMEMSPTEKIITFDFPTYIYNSNEEIAKRTSDEQARYINTELEIRSRKQFNPLIDSNVTVSATFYGGLGNQMFQIAAAESFAIDNNITSEYRVDGGVYTMGHVTKYISNILRNIKFVDTPLKNNTVVFKELNFHYQPIKSKLEKNLLIQGHFQSYKYFEHNSEKIRNLFSPSDDITKYILNKYKFYLEKNCVSLHIRRKEYKDIYKDHHRLCKIDYYKKAIELFPNADFFLIFSDEIDWCKQNLKNEKFIFIEGEEDYIDFYLMTMCKHNIIANSSYSWWAAWLNNNTNKKIVAPDPWFGPALSHHNTIDLLPKDWIKIENALI